jgi:DNA helicase-2/ATP-dependent DNA helicase PcrA
VLEARERGVPLRRQAVLFRAAHHSDVLEVELARRNIPFVKYGGLRFLDAAHVKDMLALLRVVENPRDEIAWFRALLLLEGVGPSTARRLIGGLGVTTEARGSPLRRLLADPPPVPIHAQRSLDRLREALADCARNDGGEGEPPAAAQLERLRDFLEPAIHRRYPNADARLRDLDALALLAARHATRGRFLAELALDPPDSTGDLAGPPHLDDDQLILSTIHSAKGLEWDAVHVIHAADGNIPSDMAAGDEDEVEEERRLLYVAMTRARDELWVHVPQRYYRRRDGSDPHSYAQPSRFLQPPEVRALFEPVGPDPLPEPDPPRPGGAAIGGSADERVDAVLAELLADPPG